MEWLSRYLYNQLLNVKRKVFISYHHERDQIWANTFKRLFSSYYKIFYDNSLDDEIESSDPEYVNRAIREDYIKGSSITIVLCGKETWKRRYVDWEIRSTLHYKHALLGIALPTARRTADNKVIVPTRLHLNVKSGYAHFINWTTNPKSVKNAIDIAILKSKNTHLIDNSLPKMIRNKP